MQWTHCNMTTSTIAIADFIFTCAGVVEGWGRIVNINISSGDDCPGEWNNDTQFGVSFCRVDFGELLAFTCSSANFSTNGISYWRVCGRAEGKYVGILWISFSFQ